MRNNSGSRWGKWDLHIHSPESTLYNNFKGGWDEYVKELYTRAIKENISAIGITDYYFPTGYKKLKEEYLADAEKMRKLFSEADIKKINKIGIFPNIEFRLTKFVVSKEKKLNWDDKTNFHIIFSNEVSADDIEEFVHSLTFDFEASIGLDTSKRRLTQKSLRELGSKLIKEHKPFEGKDALWVGMVNSSVDENEILKILNNDNRFKDKYLCGIPIDEDISNINWNSGGHNARKALITQCHFIFSSNEKTIQFCLGGNNKEAHIKEFKGIKPCLWGSDAHDYEKMFKPDKSRYTWIKADRTFEGLKQVIYEPELRVKIQEFCPQLKNGYQTIKRMRIIEEKENHDFSPEWINFNEDLTTIIGGKSSGKSLLLYHLAKAINEEETNNKSKGIYPYDKLKLRDVEVEWGNGDISKLSRLEDSKPITYIPQLYINIIAEKEGRKDLNNLVKETLEQNESFKSFNRNIKQKYQDKKGKIDSKLNNCITIKQRILEIRKEIQSIGKKEDIESEIKNIEVNIRKHAKNSEMSKDELKQYERLSLGQSLNNSRLERLGRLKESYFEMSSNVELIYKDSIELYKEKLGIHVNVVNRIDPLRERLYESFKGSIEEISKSQKEKLNDKIDKARMVELKISEKLREIHNQVAPLKDKLKERKLIDELSKKLKQERKKLESIKLLNRKLEGERQNLLSNFNDAKTEHKSMIELIVELKKEVSLDKYVVGDDIKIALEIGFESDKFLGFIDLFDRRKSEVNEFVSGIVDENGNACFSINSYSEELMKIAKKILDDEAPSTKLVLTESEIYDKLLTNYLTIDYVVCYKGDDIFHMSPGKRGLVLINLLIHLSNSTHPILIDQPEDNLDNRTVYNQLKTFIIEKKAKRQIIIVTHNANLVTSTDSECVIVANQSGQDKNMDNKKYKFEFVSGGLENCGVYPDNRGILYKKGIREHVCEILEGGEEAFKNRERKYGLRGW